MEECLHLQVLQPAPGVIVLRGLPDRHLGQSEQSIESADQSQQSIQIVDQSQHSKVEYTDHLDDVPRPVVSQPLRGLLTRDAASDLDPVIITT